MKRTRLKEDQIRYIIRQRQKGTGAAILAWTMQISARHVRYIWAAYHKTRTIRPHRRSGRSRNTILWLNIFTIASSHAHRRSGRSRNTILPEDVCRVLKTPDGSGPKRFLMRSGKAIKNGWRRT